MTDGTPPGPRTRTAAAPAAVGAFLLLLCGVLLLAVVPAQLAQAREYARAPACPAADAPSGDCARTTPATVRGMDEQPRGRSVRYWLTLAEDGTEATRRVRLDDEEPVYALLSVGDRVTVTHWRGEIRTVAFGGATQETHASPADDWRLPASLALLVLPLAPCVLWMAWWIRCRWPTAERVAAPLMTGLLVTAIVAGLAGFVAAMAGPGLAVAFLAMAAGVPVGALLGLLSAWLVLRRLRAAADTGDVRAVTPTERRCLPATVSGDVPYSVAGWGHLVVGEGRPSATPDPTGHFSRRDIPETLTVRRVRAFGPRDPDGWASAYRYDGVVIECEDGERAVLIAARRRDAPLILGALAAQGA
ncbi:hypothetical protein RM780_13265 [Streptomyces sp. DSM 44917]|uniref:Large integral membrane protein n=1 Tax=Streptomyces boetiae TaxID=3075541 RepID=A0ABU2L8N5_9ACTN|nr:hypothetical protein [Streptomyces sp. DSM 44917]MDT0307926.1 hypothetical protein [Streptomyces sp. DSM 44917]